MIIGEREREYRNVMRASNFAGAVVNPRRACAARVTVVGPVCVSVTQHLTSRMSNRAIKKPILHTQWHTIIKNIVGISLKRLRSRVMA